MPGIRQRVMHITLKGDLVAWVKADSATQLDNRPHVAVVPKLPGAVETMTFELGPGDHVVECRPVTPDL